MTRINGLLRRPAFVLLLAAGGIAASPAVAQSPKVGDPPEARNMRLVGDNDLQARSAYQPIIHAWRPLHRLIGHHGGTQAVPKPVNPMNGQAEFNGTSVVDVTDPKQPKYLSTFPGMEGLGEQGGGQMVRACDGKACRRAIRNAVYLLRTLRRTGARDLERHRSREVRTLTRIRAA